MTERMSGAEAMLRVLAESGVSRMFGNPGTTELPLMDALARADASGACSRPFSNRWRLG